jgi:dTMP kinase
MKLPGVLIVIEGSDGSGKGTQFNLLSERLKAAGYNVAVFDFPRYEKESSYFVRQYLNGNFGPAAEISPFTASLFYALDRYEAAKEIRAELAAGKVVLCNRYVGSNMAHQGAKFSDPVEQRGFFVWEDNLEYELLNIPRPDTNLFLRVPAEVSQKLISQKAKRSYTDKTHDEHEADIGHLRKSVATYDVLCQLFPKDFIAIECTENNQLMSIPQISNLIWEKIKPLLPDERPHAGHSAVVTLNASPTPSTPKTATNPSGKLIHEFKDASLYLKLQIERQIRSVEPAGFTVWSDNGYRFYTPQGLPKQLEAQYKSVMRNVAERHQRMRRILEAYYERNLLNPAAASMPNISELLLPATPLAALCTFKVEVSPKTVRRLCAGLLANDSVELQWAAKQLYIAARQQWPEDFKSPLESETAPESLNNIIAKLADEKLTLNSSDIQTVKLLSASPRLEFDLLAESIYPYSTLSLEEIIEEVSDWSYQQKYESLKQAAAEPGLLLDKINYKFDLITDQMLLEEVTALISSTPQAQNPSPRNGYDVSTTLEAAGIDELFIECFDDSLALFSELQAAERDDLTIYGSLLGHKLRWQLSVNAQEMKTILEHPNSESFTGLTKAMREQVSEAHPLMWEVIHGDTASPASAPKNRVKPSRRGASRKRK